MMLNRQAGDSRRDFPTEKPMPSDFKLWNEAMHAISTRTLKLSRTLGEFTCNPHRADKWFTNENRSEFYRTNSVNFYDVYTPDISLRKNRFGNRYLPGGEKWHM